MALFPIARYQKEAVAANGIKAVNHTISTTRNADF
jgi:hypothetical protein